VLSVLQKIEDTRDETDTAPPLPARFRGVTYETGNLNRLTGSLPSPSVPHRDCGNLVVLQIPHHGMVVDDSTGVAIYGELKSQWTKYVQAKGSIVGSFALNSVVYPKTNSTTEIAQLTAGLIGKPITEADPLEGYEKYAEEDWDGYDALPITAETLHAARSILKSLPKTFGDPVCSPGADGSLVFEWLKDDGPLRKLFIDIGPGRTWKAYWRLASGKTGTIPRKRVTISTIPELQKLFETLLRG
jgi:hypothetical protein